MAGLVSAVVDGGDRDRAWPDPAMHLETARVLGSIPRAPRHLR